MELPVTNPVNDTKDLPYTGLVRLLESVQDDWSWSLKICAKLFYLCLAWECDEEDGMLQHRKVAQCSLNGQFHWPYSLKQRSDEF